MTVALRSLRQAFFFKIKNEEKNSFADWVIELANRGFGMSTDAFLKSVKKFLDKEVRIMLLNNTPVICYVLFHDARLYFWNRCQTTLQVQEKLISRLPVEIYVQLRCYCCVRILGQLSRYCATQELCKNINFAMETKAKKLNCLSSY